MTSIAGQPEKSNPSHVGPLILAADEGTSYDWSKDHVVVKTPLELTEGRVTMVEDTLQPGFSLPRHRHARTVEIFYVLEGEARFAFDDKTVNATKGMVVNIPPNVWHEVTTSDGATLLTIFSPGGFDHYLAEFAAMNEADINNRELVKEVGDKHDF